MRRMQQLRTRSRAGLSKTSRCTIATTRAAPGAENLMVEVKGSTAPLGRALLTSKDFVDALAHAGPAAALCSC